MTGLLPPPPFGPQLLVRTLIVWLFLHGTMAALPYMSDSPSLLRVPFPRALMGSPLTALGIAAVTSVVVWFEMWRRRELVFLANLGHSPHGLVGVVATVCLVLDLLLALSLA